MQYAFLIKPHANARYALSMEKLALIEMQCLLLKIAPQATVWQENLAGARFMIIETEPIDERGWKILSGHSGVCFAAQKDGELLKPMQLHQAASMPADLSQILKYKGKTNADFTLMMLHCAKAASGFALSGTTLTVTDPLCGRGTSLFCALQEGYNAIGIELDKKAIHEADTYFKRYLQYHRFKHKRATLSATLPKGGHAPEIRYQISSRAAACQTGDTQSLRVFQGDAALTDSMLGAKNCHLIISDLPYGVQHAGKDKQGISSLDMLMENIFPAFSRALKTGGAAAVAFNTFTLKRYTVLKAMESAGLKPLTNPPFNDFSHWVEQAINRDMVIAVKE